jgi:hypothetical protein
MLTLDHQVLQCINRFDFYLPYMFPTLMDCGAKGYGNK